MEYPKGYFWHDPFNKPALSPSEVLNEAVKKTEYGKKYQAATRMFRSVMHLKDAIDLLRPDLKKLGRRS